ncbi:hypothetical protein J437_LFUL017537 [Ladona fulva]|uniref:Uncharacterized protein n=1 Tax=Ladona fulva TaxID=123851 RepID=A0A8K0KNF3_LADFU|nr:hypothetical protein J437_LFUL017537 [Ladona fulva]
MATEYTEFHPIESDRRSTEIGLAIDRSIAIDLLATPGLDDVLYIVISLWDAANLESFCFPFISSIGDGTGGLPPPITLLQAAEWRLRARRLDEMAAALDLLFTRLAHCNNRELVYDLYPYVWDMRGIVSLLNSYVKWLAAGQVPQMVSTYVQGTCTCMHLLFSSPNLASSKQQVFIRLKFLIKY